MIQDFSVLNATLGQQKGVAIQNAQKPFNVFRNGSIDSLFNNISIRANGAAWHLNVRCAALNHKLQS